MADSVMRRRSEIGIRMALGAERGNVIRLVPREVLVLVGAGILTGIPAALAASGSIARQASRIDPIAALRTD